MSKDVNLGKTLVEKSMSRANLGVIISAQLRMSQICLCSPETFHDSLLTRLPFTCLVHSVILTPPSEGLGILSPRIKLTISLCPRPTLMGNSASPRLPSSPGLSLQDHSIYLSIVNQFH